jgi:PKD repeat protein
VTFSAGESYDPDGSIVRYTWDFGDGDSASEGNVTHEYSEAGAYTVTLTVTDDRDAKALANTTITVNGLPKAVATVEKSIFKVHEGVLFMADGSSDPEGRIDSYLWDFGDGAMSSTMNAQHSYNTDGPYEVTLTVKDDRNARSTAKLSVDVVSRDYHISWAQMNVSTDYNGYTQERDSTNKTQTITQTNILRVAVTLEWNDDLPFTIVEEDNATYQDEFGLYVESPKKVNASTHNKDGKAYISFQLNSVPKEFDVEANDETEAHMAAKKKSPESSDGTGTWLMVVTALNCTGGFFRDGLFEVDPGNQWSLTLQYFYYEMVVTEV